MTRMHATKARQTFAETVNRVAYKGERIVLERHGKPVLALVPVADLELLEELEDRIDLEEARKALRAARGKRTLPWAKVKAELNLP
jgi:prevent-host-death family protein